MNRTWIKLYLEILDDPKMGRFPNHLWRRAIELFLLAGRNGNDGTLPPVEEIAWTLRLEEIKLLEDLHGLAEVGVVHEAEPGIWKVTNFSKRQAAMTESERTALYRSRHEGVTFRDKKSDAESNEAEVTDSSSTSSLSSNSVSGGGEGTGEGEVFCSFEQNIGLLTPIITDGLKTDIDQYSAEWVLTAIEYAARQQKPSLAYIEGTLKGWKRDGLANPSAKPTRFPSGPKYPARSRGIQSPQFVQPELPPEEAAKITAQLAEQLGCKAKNREKI